ncbi:TlpA disulfide reductase family protein [Roseimicrobium sp. ORNL1]|uniref:TlpA family protein disulfide reductase n=1 Tax=Roseimicrobium sp. ORNL1 TaxID=2711231 RepID=UPI0013E1C94E|nr:TlpA disulfide reductase family protein [Roseimicrobium sp. ORNL1]QIF04533.1 TlpA family protein disulfide reductase [Roseimicrobium sp. ORNL1]
MANNLTGDYEAVVQISVRQINGLLATLHQNGVSENAPLKLLHSVDTRIGDPRRKFPDHVIDFGDWVLELQQEKGPRPIKDLQDHLISTSPPGVATKFQGIFDHLGDVVVGELEPEVIRGRARVQISTLQISFPEGSSSEVIIHAHARAHYYPDPDTGELAKPVHGEVQATFEVRTTVAGGVRKLHIKPSNQDAKIRFIAEPSSGISTADANKLGAQIRKLIREGIELMPVTLPAGFPFSQFKGIGTVGQVLTLPLQLSGAGAPASGVQPLHTSFVGSSGFAFAVRKEHIQGLIDVEAIRASIAARSITLRLERFGVGVSVTYKLRFSSGPTMTFKAGSIELSGRVEAETDTFWAPNGFVSFKQGIRIRLNTATQVASLRRIGDPDVDESWFIPSGTATNIVRSEIDKALEANEDSVEAVFDDARAKLTNGLRTFDNASTVRYSGVEITVDGVIVRGDIGGPGRPNPIVEVRETEQAQSFTALRSWIPGGRVLRHIWSWVEYPAFPPTAWSGVAKSATEFNRFVFPKPPGITQLSSICLRIEGTQILANGQTRNISGGTTCIAPQPEVVMDIPAWWEPVTLPTWTPDVSDDTILREAISGHVTVLTDRPRKLGIGHNTLVCFPEWPAENLLQSLHEVLRKLKRKNYSLLVILVLPEGAFDVTRKEMEARLALREGKFPVSVQLTEDDDGGWSRTFAVSKRPSCYLINARREFVWKHEGTPDPDKFAAILEEKLVVAPGPRTQPLRLAVDTGASAPDITFEDASRERSALHRMRGQTLLLNFWQSWSAPCLAELERLQLLHEKGGENMPRILSFHGGKDVKKMEEIRQRLGLTFTVVQDPEQRQARKYGVRCWPTTIEVNADGNVEHVQFGVDHHHDERGYTDDDVAQTAPGA